MGFFKKIGESAKATAATVGAKSADFAEATKLKIAKSRLEGEIKDYKTELGHVMYEAHKNGIEPNKAALQAGYQRIANAESEIKEIDMKLSGQSPVQSAPLRETPAPAMPQQGSPALVPHADSAPAPAGKFCPNCGTALGPDAQFCGNCGTRIS